MSPPSSTDRTVPIAAEVAIVIAAGLVWSAIFKKPSWLLGLSPTVTASPSVISDCTSVISATPTSPA